ncbi:MAG: type II toxin-antitoxin system VapC family toxin [Oscillochloridaceae bacterium umkhey_bin13]
MGVFYADSSVLVKRHVVEVGSTWVENLCDPEQGNEIITSRLSAVEVVSALNRRVREGSIPTEDYPGLRDDFLALCRQRYWLIQTTNPVLARARLLLERHVIRSYDALHLASALIAHDRRVMIGLAKLTFLAADQRLLAAAIAEGLVVDNPNNHS